MRLAIHYGRRKKKTQKIVSTKLERKGYYYDERFSAPMRSIHITPKYDHHDDIYYEFPVHVNDDLFAKNLPYIPEIRSITLISTNVTNEGIKFLFHLPLLEGFSLGTQDSDNHPILVTGDGLKLISRHPSLRRFSLSVVDISDETLQNILENGQSITSFSIKSDLITDKGLEPLQNMRSLEDFSLTSASISNKGFEALKNMKSLRHLLFDKKNDTIVVNNTVTADVFLSLSQCPPLRSFDFRDCDFSSPPSEELIEAIKKMDGQLSSVKFFGGRIHPKLFKTIFELKSLKGATLFGFESSSKPIGTFPYHRLMYLTRKSDYWNLPDYYEELEKPYFDEFYMRTWTYIDGQRTFQAALVDVEGDNVFLKTSYDGEPYSVPLAELSEEDQDYVRNVTSPPGTQL